MKTVLLLLGLLTQLVQSPTSIAPRPMSEHRAEEIKDGLKLIVKTDKLSYSSREVIVLQAVFTNVGDKPIFISKYQFYEDGDKNGGYFTFGIVVKHTGAIVPNRVYGGPRFRKNTPGKEFAFIKPNESFQVTKHIDLKEYDCPLTELQFQALYHSYWNQGEVEEINNLWGQEKGVLYAKPIIVSIDKH